jgi:two-component system cell cycle sensor histidine kinase/response regulator CckA
VRLAQQGKEKRDLLAWSYGIRTPIESYHFQFYRDVSKETALTGTLIQSEKMAAVGRLVGAIAHEINNPIAGILATSQIILSEPAGINPSLEDDMKEIRDAAWRSKKIIDDLLGFTESDGRAFEEIDLTDVVRSALTFSKSALGEIKVKNSVSSCFLKTSSNSLQQVLFNLITNAAQAMNGKGELILKNTEGLDFITLSVEDTGPGIAPERLKHIFDPFFTSKQEGSGTGLGLSIVKNLAARIGVKISVESTLGVGTKFQLLIPKRETHA